MYIDSGWDFVSIAQLRWGEGVGTGSRQLVVLGDEHWWFCGAEEFAADPADSGACAAEVLALADRDRVRYTAVIMEVPQARLEWFPDAYPFDRAYRAMAQRRGIHHMGTYFFDPEGWFGTGPMKTFSTYLGAEDYPTIDVRNAKTFPGPRRTVAGLAAEANPCGIDPEYPLEPTHA